VELVTPLVAASLVVNLAAGHVSVTVVQPSLITELAIADSISIELIRRAVNGTVLLQRAVAARLVA
jgi:hypothetical protein